MVFGEDKWSEALASWEGYFGTWEGGVDEVVCKGKSYKGGESGIVQLGR